MDKMDPASFQILLSIVKASRPAGWCFGPILFTIGLIHSRSIPKDLTSVLKAVAQVLSLSFPLCSIVFGMNDVYDYNSDIRNPRKMASGLEGGVLSPVYHPSVRMAAYISTVLILLASLSTHRLQNVFAVTVLLILSWQYSALPLRLKEVPLLDSFSNGVIVFTSWFVGYSFGGGSLSNAPRKGYILALCAAGVHALGAATDVDSDVAAGQRTIATSLGPRPAAMFSAFAYGVALSIEDPTSIFGVYLWGGFALVIPPCLHVQRAHYAFKAVVFWTVGMSMVWFSSKASTAKF